MNWKKTEKALRTALKDQQQHLRLKDTAEYPLAFNVEMPDDYPFANGNISFRLADFICTGLDDVRLLNRRPAKGGDKINISLALNRVAVTGHYEINSKEAPVIDMDTAGTLLDYEHDRDLLRAAGADEGETPALSAGEQQEFRDTAHEQEDRLRAMDNPNGQKLMARYDEHNEVYNEIFVKSETARETWRADGATAEMAKDTHHSVKYDPTQTVNSDSKVYSNDRTYNSNAFIQQLNISIHSLYRDPNYKRGKYEPDPDSKYTKASIAALEFGMAVEQHTGNGDDEDGESVKVNPLTADEVYEHVDSFDGVPPKVDPGMLKNLLSQGNNPAGAKEARKKGWIVLTEKQRKLVRVWTLMHMREEAKNQNTASTPLWSGNCEAVITNSVVDMELAVDAETSAISVINTTVSLPSFEFDLDDSAWQGAAAHVVRDRLAQIYFIKSLIGQQIELGIRTILARSLSSAWR